MSKLLIHIDSEIVGIEANDYAWVTANLYFEFNLPADDSYIVGTDRYTLDHEHALKQGDNHHASN